MTKQDPDFTAESIALGYHPFVRFSPLEFYAMRDLYGAFAFGQIFPRLKDPARLHPEWAARFMWAASSLPRDEVLAAEDVHSLVTQAKAYRRRGPPNPREFVDAFFRAYHIFKSGNGNATEAERPIYQADCERWKLELKRRNEAKQNEQRLKAEKDARRAKAQDEEKAAIAKKAAAAKEAAKAAEKPSEPAQPQAQAKPKPSEEKRKHAAPQPVIERKGGPRSMHNSAIPTSHGVWRNPNSQAVTGNPPTRGSRQVVTVIRKSEAK